MSEAARLMIRAALLLLLIPSADARPHAPGRDLKPGAHAVGFRFIYKLDYSRGWKAEEDASGYARGEGRGRPIRVGVWYPARVRADAPRMSYRDYMPSTAGSAVFAELNRRLEERDAGNLRAGLKAEEFESLMTTRMAAVRDAAPRRGAFPLVAYSAGLNNSSQDNVVLCEYLASHGYVVVTVPQLGTTSLDVNLRFPNAGDLETQALDLQYAVGAVRDFPAAGRRPLGVVGYSVGGVVALSLAMRGSDVDAVVTLDPTFGVAPYVKLATDSPYYAATNLRIPWAYIFRAEPATSLAVFDGLKYSTRYNLEFTGMLHQDFSSLPMLAPQSATTTARTPETARRGHQAACRYVLNFFDAQLKRDARALESIGRGPSESVAGFEVREGIRPPPTEEKFLRVLGREGFDRALRLYRESRAGDPRQPVFREDFLNQLGYRLMAQNRLAEAVEIFKLNVDAYPSSANAYDSLAEAYMRSGDREPAIKFYERSIELNPNNTGAAEALKKLKGGP